jgi:hypothetical protein
MIQSPKLLPFSLLLILTLLPFKDLFSAESTEPVMKALIFTGDGGQHKKRHLKKIRSYLSRQGCGVEVAYNNEEGTVPAGTDLFFTSLSPSEIKKRHKNFHFLAQARTIEGKNRVGGAVLVIKSTGIDKLALLKGERFSFVSPSSSSGYQLPLADLVKAGVNPSEEQTVFVGNHVGAVSMLLHGDTFAAAAAAPLARDWLGINNELSIVALTPSVETGGWWINTRIPEKKAATCAKLLSELSGTQLKMFPAWIGGFNPR